MTVQLHMEIERKNQRKLGVIQLNWLDKLERKLGRFAIPNLTVYLLVGYVIGFGIVNLMRDMVGYLTLEPALILRGQVWRLISWVLIPPTDNLISLVFLVLLYYSLGTALERTWGSFRYNVYIFSGLLFTVLAVFGLYVFYYFRYGVEVPLSAVGLIGTNYITMSIFLACAASIPDVRVLLMFVFPIKVKWLGIIYGVMLVVSCIQGGLVTWIVVGFSLLNFLVYFIGSKGKMHLNAGQVKMRHEFRHKMRAAEHQSRGITRHKCAVCGRTELDGDDLEFRFCSKCNGNYEYCQDHLFTHEHVK